MRDLGECLKLDADNLPSAVHLSSVQASKPSSENYGLIRYRGNLLAHCQTFIAHWCIKSLYMDLLQLKGCTSKLCLLVFVLFK